jgi:putative endonuclease
MARTFHVYILSYRRRTVLYTGITNNLLARLEMHLAGTGSVFVSRYKVFDLVYFEAHDKPEDAIAREKQIKGWRRVKKLTLILGANPKMNDLKSQLM